MVTRRVVVAAACLVAILAAAAAAQPGGTIVAESDGYTLRAYERHRNICLTLKGNGEDQRNCGLPGLPTDFVSANAADVGFGFGFGSLPSSPVPPVFAAAVPSDILEVALETRAGVQRYPTVAADGFEARFVIAPDVADRIEFVRLYDDEGVLVSAGLPGFFGHVTDRYRAFARHGTRIILGRTHELRGDLLRPDRLVESTCITRRIGHGGSSSCTGDDILGARPLTVEQACAPRRPLLYGVLRPAAREIDVVLGSGRHLRGATQALPAAFDGLRFAVREIPPGAAVRSARLLDSGGRTLRRMVLGAPPSGQPCDDTDGVSISGFGVSVDGHGNAVGDTPPVAVAEAGDHRLLAADGSRRSLCVALDDVRDRDCQDTPPAAPIFGSFEREGRLVYGLLPGRVVRVDLQLDDGSHQAAGPVAGAAYSGRYAGRVGFLLTRIPAGRRVKRAKLYLEGGSQIGYGFVGRSSPRRRTGRIPGSPLRTFAQQGGSDAQQNTTHCSFLPGTLRLTYPSCAYGRRTFSRSLTVTCKPRQIAATGLLGRGMTAVLGELSDGRTLAARILHPTRRQGGGRVFLLTVPRSAGLVALRTVGGKLPRFADRREVVNLPPAAEQCGYAVGVF